MDPAGHGQRDGDVDQLQQQVEQCLERVEPSASEQRELLQRGLQLTGQALRLDEAPTGPPGPPGDSRGSPPPGGAGLDTDRPRWFRAARLRLLQHLDRLDTVLALNNDAWNPAAFASLRDCTIAEAAAALASAGRLAALPLLLQRHPRALLPSVLEVLTAIPETLDPKQYAPLLRQVASLQQPPALARPADSVESAETAAELREHSQYALLLATEPMCAAGGGWHPPTQRQLANWACERAQQLDAVTGQLPHAATLLEAAQAALHFGEAGIASLLAAVQELLSLVKLAASRQEGGSSSSSTWRTGLRQYGALGPQQRLALLLGLLGSGDTLASDLSLHVVPFLARLHSGGSSDEAADPQVVLRQALEGEAARRLSWTVRVIQCEARQRAAFASAAQLAKTAAACCYACTASDAWELMSSMLKAAREAVRGDEELEEEEQEAAEEALELVRGHVTTARLLTKHGLTTPVSMVRDADRGAALRLLRTLLARVSRTKNTESRWVDMWMDLRTIQEHGFTQLSEEVVRTEFCRALLRVGQYRLCKTYLQGLPAEAAEQVVLAAAKEVFLSASSLADKAVKQAKECLALLPDSAAGQEQLGAIAAGEQLKQLGLDLPPLQLQQLREQAASGGGKVLEQLVGDHPQLAAADSAKLMQVAAALGIRQQPEPLLLRAAEAAHASGNRARTRGLLLQLAAMQYRPAWQLAAAVAAERGCAGSTQLRLLVFALASAPAEQLFSLLEQWEAADSGSGGSGNGGGGWELAPIATPAAGGGPSGLQEAQRGQQLWLAQQLKQHFLRLGSVGVGSGSAGWDDAAAALGCLQALGPRGLALWERLLQEEAQRPLAHQQRRRALLLGLTAAGLQALQPADLDLSALDPALDAAEARLEASPAELLRLVQQKQQQQQEQQQAATAAVPGLAGDKQQQQLLQQSASSDGEQGLARSETASEAGEAASSSEASATPPPKGAGIAAISPAYMATAAAAAAAERFRDLLDSAAAAQQLQGLLPGVDAAASLSGGPASRRRLVLQLAAAAGMPPSLRAAGAGVPPSPSPSPSPAALPSPARRQSTAWGTPSPSCSSSAAVRRMPSRKKSEAWGSPGPEDEPKPAATAPAASSSNAGGAARWQLDAAAAAGTMQQALLLAAKCEVPAWEVHLAFAESLLVHNQRLWEQQQPGVTMQQLLEASLAVLHPGPQQAGVTPEWLLDASLEVLLAGAQPAAALLGVLLRSVWRASSSSCPRHLALCLQLAHRSAAALAAAAADGGGGQRWQQAAAVLAACHAAVEQLLQAAPGLDAKLFLHPVVQQLAASLPGCSADSEGSSQQPRGQHSQPVSSQALNWQLLAYASGSNAAHLASAVEMLARQCNGLAAAAQSAPAAEADGGSSGGCGAGYPSSGSTVFMALFCRSTSQQCAARGGLDAAAVQQSLECLRRMSPAHAAAAAAFAAAGGPCPLPLPPGREQPVAVALLEQQQAQVLAAALQVLDGSSMAEPAGTAGVDPHLQQQIEQLRQQHALLAAKGCIAAACPDASRAQLAAAREAAEAVQRAALVAAAAPGSEGGSRGEEGPSSALDSCLQQLLTTGTPAPAVLRVAAVLEALQQQPSQAPPEADALLAQPVAAAAAQQAASAAAAAEVAAALGAMSGLPSSGTPQEQQLSPGDAVQNLFALLRSLHSAAASEADEGGSGSPAAAAAAVAQAVAAMRLLVWQQLQRKAASYDGSGGAAASEAHVQVLELLGSVGSSGMWPGWAPHDLPAVEAGPGGDEGGGAGGGFSHRQVLLFTRTAAALALEWQAAMQECRLSAADFGSAESAEAALLRLAAAAEEAQQLRLLLRLLAEVLDGAFPAAAAARSEAAAAAEGAGESGSSSPAASPGAAASAGAAVVPLHRVWSTCLRMLLPLGDLAGVLAALDDHSAQQAQRQQRQQGQQEQEQGGGLQAAGMPRALVSEAEAAALLEAADAAQGVAAAAALALLLPYTRLQLERWQLLVQACASAGSTAADLAAALPALAPLLLLLVQRQPGLLVDLVGGRQQQQFKLLVGAALLQQQREPSYGVSLGGSSLTLRMAVAAAAAAVLTAARQHTAAAWLAMQACSTPRLLQVLDSGSRVLQQLLCSCSAGGAAAAGALAAARRLAAAGGDAQLAVPQAAAALLQALPEQCAEALCQLTSDLQLAH